MGRASGFRTSAAPAVEVEQMGPRGRSFRLAALLAVLTAAVVPGSAVAAFGVREWRTPLSTPVNAPLADSRIAYFSDDAMGIQNEYVCDATRYRATVDWGDATTRDRTPNNVTVDQRFGGFDGTFNGCAYTVRATHVY